MNLIAFPRGRNSARFLQRGRLWSITKSRYYFVLCGSIPPISIACARVVSPADRHDVWCAVGRVVRAVLSPAHGKGTEWCQGRFHGLITLVADYACPARGTCHSPPGFPTRRRTVARFGFRVRWAPGAKGGRGASTSPVGYSTSGGSSSEALMCSDSAVAAIRWAASRSWSSWALSSAAA
jgi:hypothetical protein